MTHTEALAAVEKEIARARRHYKVFPSHIESMPRGSHSRVEAAAIVVEEAGEVLKAALNLRPYDKHYETSTVAQFEKELIQTAAMAFRALEEL